MLGQMCREYFKNSLRMTEHLTKIHRIFLLPSQRYQDFRYILPNQKHELKNNLSSTPTAQKSQGLRAFITNNSCLNYLYTYQEIQYQTQGFLFVWTFMLPTGILKRGELESSGQRLISLKGKTKRKAFLFLFFLLKKNIFKYFKNN